jgi:hypothetical protein
MAYVLTDDIAGLPVIGSALDHQAIPACAGMLVHAIDPVLGGGEFVYLEGGAGVVLGSVVSFNQLTKTVALATTASTGLPVAVAMAATPAGFWGYFQTVGNARAAMTAAAIALGAGVAVSATAGQVVSGTLGTAGNIGVCNQAALATDTLVNVQINQPRVL